MDVFFEQIIKKKSSPLQKILKTAFIVVAVLFIALLVAWAFVWLTSPIPLYSIIGSVCIGVAFGVGFLTRWYVKRLSIEYEYSITNGDFDIDRILGKSKRDRIISTNCQDFEEFGLYDSIAKEKLSHREFDSKVLSANLDEEPLYYAVVNHKTAGRVLIVIQPNERIISALKKFIPRMVQNDVFGRN